MYLLPILNVYLFYLFVLKDKKKEINTFSVNFQRLYIDIRAQNKTNENKIRSKIYIHSVRLFSFCPSIETFSSWQAQVSIHFDDVLIEIYVVVDEIYHVAKFKTNLICFTSFELTLGLFPSVFNSFR